MSRQRKTAAVLRLLRGEDLETVSRSLGVTAATLTAWRDAFLAAGEAALVTRPESGEALESERLKAKLGEVTIERDLSSLIVEVMPQNDVGRKIRANLSTDMFFYIMRVIRSLIINSSKPIFA